MSSFFAVKLDMPLSKSQMQKIFFQKCIKNDPRFAEVYLSGDGDSTLNPRGFLMNPRPGDIDYDDEIHSYDDDLDPYEGVDEPHPYGTDFDYNPYEGEDEGIEDW